LISTLFSALLRVHLTCALGATALFWIAAVSRKGGPRHRFAGRWFASLVYATAVTGATMAIAQLAGPELVHPPDLTRAADLLGAFAYPSAGNVRPHLIFYPRLGFVADPAGFTRKNQRWLAFQGQQNIHIAVHNLESGRIENRALEARVLIAADNQGVQTSGRHARTNVLVTAINFRLTRQL
jgi:uncharacterized membrane protein